MSWTERIASNMHWLGRHQESITCSCSVQGWKDLESKINSKRWNSLGIGSGQGCCHPSCVTRLMAGNLCIKWTLCNGRNTKIQRTRRHKYKGMFMESETPDGAHELVVVGAHLVAADGFLGLHSHQLLQSQLDFCHQPRQCRCQFTENWQQYPRPISLLLAMISISIAIGPHLPSSNPEQMPLLQICQFSKFHLCFYIKSSQQYLWEQNPDYNFLPAHIFFWHLMLSVKSVFILTEFILTDNYNLSSQYLYLHWL